MTHLPTTPARELTVGDLISLKEMLDEMGGEDSRWVPFGGNDTEIASMMDSVRKTASREPATVQRIDYLESGFVMVYTDQLKFSIPSGYRFDVEQRVSPSTTPDAR